MLRNTKPDRGHGPSLRELQAAYPKGQFWAAFMAAQSPTTACPPTICPHCRNMFRNGDTCCFGGCPMGGDF